MTVLDALNWPVLKCLRLAGFEVSPEDQFFKFRDRGVNQASFDANVQYSQGLGCF